jgi:hypothetical protein
MAGIAGMSGASANDEADPRPSPVDGTQPNENVPTVETGPLGEQPWNFDRSDVPVGHWIVNNLTWISRNPSSLRTMLNNSVQTVTIFLERENPGLQAGSESRHQMPNPQSIARTGYSLRREP